MHSILCFAIQARTICMYKGNRYTLNYFYLLKLMFKWVNGIFNQRPLVSPPNLRQCYNNDIQPTGLISVGSCLPLQKKQRFFLYTIQITNRMVFLAKLLFNFRER